MPLREGQALSHYRIERKIGEGGMGEVWSATDTRLNRPAAIKALPEGLAHDPERLARFRREAQLLASLNHPNIAGIYGLEQEGDTSYLAMELVDGVELAERLDGNAIPLDEALEFARQIADALEEAHDKGIVHRDLKPANMRRQGFLQRSCVTGPWRRITLRALLIAGTDHHPRYQTLIPIPTTMPIPTRPLRMISVRGR